MTPTAQNVLRHLEQVVLSHADGQISAEQAVRAVRDAVAAWTAGGRA